MSPKSRAFSHPARPAVRSAFLPRLALLLGLITALSAAAGPLAGAASLRSAPSLRSAATLRSAPSLRSAPTLRSQTSRSQTSRAPTLRSQTSRSQTLPGTTCPAFPADNVWNTPVTGLPVDPRSATWLAHMDAGSTFLHPDYGPGGTAASPYGIPWQITSPQPTFVQINFLYASQSDRGPYPFSAATPIEGGPAATGDRHAIMVNPRTCQL